MKIGEMAKEKKRRKIVNKKSMYIQNIYVHISSKT